MTTTKTGNLRAGCWKPEDDDELDDEDERV